MNAARRDVAVVGAGFGGLATALSLAEAGASVTLFEALNYPGGCASTFEKRGHRFEAGATLFSGFGEGQLMRRWIDRYGLDVQVDALDPMVELRAPGLKLPIPPSRPGLVERLCALPGAPTERVRAFFDEQTRVADALWTLFDDPTLMPPFGPAEMCRHLTRAPSYLPLLRLVGRPLLRALERHGLEAWAPLRCYLDAVCQITVQASAAEAEAPFAMAAMDYYFRGTGHVHGGVGNLAWGLVEAIRAAGGEVRMAERVKALVPIDGGWRVTSRRDVTEVTAVAANVLPQGLRALLDLQPGAIPRLDALSERVEGGWGAAMLYRVARAEALDLSGPHHVEIVQDPSAPFLEGNHLFCSIGDADAEGLAPVTLSTHVPMPRLRGLVGEARGAYVAEIQERMRAGVAALYPALADATVDEMTASPRTFERFTRRPEGLVGGVPRRAGLDNYQRMLPRPIRPGLYLVGDTVFPGQSTLGVAVGGVKLAGVIARRI